ncbi:hypothetical protein [Crateriforma conspicua]|uniref:Chromosome partition protein Smc n=1 Tax=Crateriforma conspicua TaxID=2527996 RepID=A0A5C5Y9B7_9PLAN|nr:hypothetical protein [Crateriforma conspicua]TWT71498.1 Chromosome partition protein Smc [Crateriforma conspicua]
MSLTSLLDSITNRQESRKRSKWSDYKSLVAAICDGREPGADVVAQTLADNEKTLDGLRHDVLLLEKRRNLRAEMDAGPPLDSEDRKLAKQIDRAETELKQLVDEREAAMAPMYQRQHEIKQIRKRATEAQRELRSTCEDKELLEEYEATRERYHEAQTECDHLEKEIAQHQRWAVIDREKAEMAGVKAEVTRYNRQADDYEAKIARFQEQLEPLSEHAADLHAMLAEIESRFLVP